MEQSLRVNGTYTAVPIPRPFNWRVFGILWVLSTAGFLAGLPAQLSLTHLTLSTSFLLFQIAEQFVLNALFVGVGLLLATRVGMGLPILEDWLAGRGVRATLLEALRLAVFAGLILSAFAVAADRLVFIPLTAAALPGNTVVPLWQNALASLYGGIFEESQSRLLVMTLFVWLLSRLPALRSAGSQPKAGVFLAANLMAALLFALSHLPATALAGMPITPPIVARAVVLNAIPAVGFGWLYWRRGLESAMVAHFTGDVVLHIIVPLVLPR